MSIHPSLRTTHLVRTCERVTVTRIRVNEGAGVPGDPVRQVTYIYDDDGVLIARLDPDVDA